MEDREGIKEAANPSSLCPALPAAIVSLNFFLTSEPAASVRARDPPTISIWLAVKRMCNAVRTSCVVGAQLRLSPTISR
jgi:hypothetical protein